MRIVAVCAPQKIGESCTVPVCVEVEHQLDAGVEGENVMCDCPHTSQAAHTW